MNQPVRLSRISLRIAVGSSMAAVLLWLLSSLLYRDAGRAWSVLAGIESPFDSNTAASCFGLLLSIFGYLLVPVMIGLIVSVGIDEWVRDQRKPIADLKRDLDQLVGAYTAALRNDGDPGDAGPAESEPPK